MPAEERGPDLRQASKVTRPRRLAQGPATPLERVRKLQISLHAKAKRRFSELSRDAACNQEYAGGLKQGLHDEAEPIVAQREAPVLEHPGIAALDRPAPLAEP